MVRRLAPWTLIYFVLSDWQIEGAKPFPPCQPLPLLCRWRRCIPAAIIQRLNLCE